MKPSNACANGAAQTVRPFEAESVTRLVPMRRERMTTRTTNGGVRIVKLAGRRAGGFSQWRSCEELQPAFWHYWGCPRGPFTEVTPPEPGAGAGQASRLGIAAGSAPAWTGSMHAPTTFGF